MSRFGLSLTIGEYRDIDEPPLKAPVGVGGLRGLGGGARFPPLKLVLRGPGATLGGFLASVRPLAFPRCTSRGGCPVWFRMVGDGPPLLSSRGGGAPLATGGFGPPLRGLCGLGRYDMLGRALLKFGTGRLSLLSALVPVLSGGVIGLASPMSVALYLGGNKSREDPLTSVVVTATSFSDLDNGTSSLVEDVLEFLLFPRLIGFSCLLAMTNSGSSSSCL